LGRFGSELTRSDFAPERRVTAYPTRDAFVGFPSFTARSEPNLKVGNGSIAVADDLSKVPESRAKGASSKFLNSGTVPHPAG
jgi:hypothetical protein